MTYQSEELTPWFPGRVKPARKGVYETVDGDLNDSRFYCLWDGKHWYYGHGDLGKGYGWNWDVWKDDAASLKSWRGLARKPKRRT